MQVPRVTVVVVTYNSEHFITDTLDSIKAQSYRNLELVITDDASKDNTVEVCRMWAEQHSEHFVSLKLLNAKVNGGISANCLSGVNASSGEWVKFIGGDDLLVPDCISNFVDFALLNKYDCVISDMKSLQNGKISPYDLTAKQLARFFSFDVNKKYYSYICEPFFLNAPASFFSKKMLDDIQPFYPEYKLLEDQPLFISILKNGYDIGHLPKATVIYRRHAASSTGSFKKNLYITLYRCYKEFREPFIKNTFAGRLLKRSWEGHYNTVIETYDKPSKTDRLMNNIYMKAIHLLSLLKN